jgi:HlyD family secretion protein
MRSFYALFFLFILLHSGCNRNQPVADAWGNFEARHTLISAQANGRILALNVDQGEWIDEGRIAAVIDTVPHVLALQRLVSQKKSMVSRLSEIDANIDVYTVQKSNLQREINRTGRLLEDFAATQQQLDDLTGRLNVIEKQVLAAGLTKNNLFAELEAMDVQMRLAQEQLAYCSVRNPFRGLVLEKYAELHEITAAGKPLYKLADISTMDLRVYVSGSQLTQLAPGQKVRVLVDDATGKLREVEGTINWISSRAEFTPKTIQTREERITQVYAVRITVPNPDGTLKIGMPGEVIFRRDN